MRHNIRAVMETIYGALDVLKSLSLIEENIANLFPRTVEVCLSEKGKAVANHVAAIQTLLDTRE